MWAPNRAFQEASNLFAYMQWLRGNGYPSFGDYAALHDWSVRAPESFWKSLSEWLEMPWVDPPTRILSRRSMPFARWFEGGTFNFSEAMLRPWRRDPERLAIVGLDESGARRELDGRTLVAEVESLANALAARGVVAGDRVAGFVTNGPEAIVAMLATTRLGAIWSSCSPDFGVPGVLDRFGQIAPKVLFAVEGYAYQGS